jgi:molecular chaperone HscB
MNYFEYYGIPVSFVVDEKSVRDKFLSLSKKLHPDFYVNESPEKQQEMLEQSTLNTKAYETLSDFDKRMKYILEEKQLIYEGERYTLSPDFLMEMMDINEGLIELKDNTDETRLTDYKGEIESLLQDLFSEVKEEINSYDGTPEKESMLTKIKDYYYRKKYLLRIQRSLDTLAARS